MDGMYGVDYQIEDEIASEDELDDIIYNSQEAVLFLIESTPTMLQSLDSSLLPPSEADPTPSASTQNQQPSTFVAPTRPTSKVETGWKGQEPSCTLVLALRCAYAMMKRKVNSAPKDKIGVCVFNTASGKDNLLMILPLEIPRAESIKKLRDLLQEAEQDPEAFATAHLPQNERGNNLVPALTYAKGLLKEASTANCDKRIFFVTDNDSPAVDVKPARKQLEDMNDVNIEFIPFFIPPQNQTFSMAKVYNRLIHGTIDEEDQANQPDIIPSDNFYRALQNMIDKMSTNDVKRIVFGIKFELAPGVVIGIKGYNLIGVKKIPSPARADLNSAEGMIFKSETRLVDTDTLNVVDKKTEVKKFLQVGKASTDGFVPPKRVFLDDVEIRKIKHVGMSIGLKLLGFKPIAELTHPEDTIKHSHFIQPDELTYHGSIRAFAALLESMLKKKKAALCIFLPRSSSRPQHVTLIAQEEVLDAMGHQVVPPGLHLCQLPFADDLRHITVAKGNSAYITPGSQDDPSIIREQPIIQAAKKIVRAVIDPKPHNPKKFPNPALNLHLETIAAIALDEELPTEWEDPSKPNFALIDRRAGNRVTHLRTLIATDEIDFSTVAVSKAKRETTPPPPASPATLKHFAKAIGIGGSKLTVAVLKEGLTAMGLSKSGNKPELYLRAKEALQAQGIMPGGRDVEMRDEKKEKKPVKRENGMEMKKEKGKASKYDSMEDDSDPEPSRVRKVKKESSSPKKKSKEDWDSSSDLEMKDSKPNLLFLDDDSD